MQISDAEWTVMNLVWKSGPMDAARVIQYVAKDNGWSAATVKTMLHRLVRKRALATDKEGRRFVYRAAIDRDECIRKASRSFLDRVFGGEAAPALVQLVKLSEISPKEAAQLRALLDEKEL